MGVESMASIRMKKKKLKGKMKRIKVEYKVKLGSKLSQQPSSPATAPEMLVGI
jgi:hypothetical protein